MLTQLLEVLLCARKTKRQNRVPAGNMPVIEFVASSAHLVQSWERALGRAQGSRLRCDEAK